MIFFLCMQDLLKKTKVKFGSPQIQEKENGEEK